MIAARFSVLGALMLLASRGLPAAEKKNPPPAEAAFAMTEVPLFGKASERAKGRKVEAVRGQFAARLHRTTDFSE